VPFHTDKDATEDGYPRQGCTVVWKSRNRNHPRISRKLGCKNQSGDTNKDKIEGPSS
jgi:hypothetical protein